MKKQILITIISGTAIVGGAVAYSVLSKKTEDKTVITEILHESKDGNQKIVAVEEVKNNTITLKVPGNLSEKKINRIKMLIKQEKVRDAKKIISDHYFFKGDGGTLPKTMKFKL